MTLSEAFKQAVDESPITHTELSWSMHISLERLGEILNGANYVPNEELEMLRFIFKAKHKKDIEIMNLMTPPQGVPEPEN